MLNASEYIKLIKYAGVGVCGQCPKESEKLFVEKKSKPLPLPTLKLSEPPGAVRPDGNQTSLQYCLPRTVTSKINKLSPIVPITIGIMLLNGASQGTLIADHQLAKQKKLN